MRITTTCIGAYPKPGYVAIGNFSETGAPDDGHTRDFSYTQDDAADVAEELLLRATGEAVRDQIDSIALHSGNRHGAIFGSAPFTRTLT